MKILPEALRFYIGDALPETMDIEKLFTFHAFEIDGIDEVGEYEVVDVKVLPDRSSDCLCHRGVAHELAALMGTKLVKDPLREPAHLEPVIEKLHVTIEDTENCRRFSGALVTGVTVSPSPLWLKNVLEALGQRSINNVVDATNYVMLMLGQPLHAYDADKFPHDETGWHFGVRMARDGEEVTTLSNETYTCTSSVQFITEAKSDTPVGIAGIKGGKSAAIDERTKNIILEAASFDSAVTRRSSQSLKLQTDASKRFENELPPALTAYGLLECVRLIVEIAGGACEGYVDEFPNPQSNTPVTVSHAKVEALLGVSIQKENIEAIFARLGFTYEVTNDGWAVTAPFERTDIKISEDVIADIGRVYGYEHVEAVVPTPVILPEYNAKHYYAEKIRTILINEGFSEVITSSFRKNDEIELLNALASDKGCLRSSLRENIREVLDKNIPNLDLLGVPNIAVFEIGTVFEKTHDGSDVTEYVALTLGVRQKQQGYTPKDDTELSRIVEILEKTLGVSLSGTLAKGVYECDLTALLTKLPAPTKYDAYEKGNDVTFKAYSMYPFISRDIALWTPEDTIASDIEQILREKAGDLLVRLSLFDEFKKDGRVSYAFRLVFQSFERTLTDEEVNTIMETMYTMLKEKGYEIR